MSRCFTMEYVQGIVVCCWIIAYGNQVYSQLDDVFVLLYLSYCALLSEFLNNPTSFYLYQLCVSVNI